MTSRHNLLSITSKATLLLWKIWLFSFYRLFMVWILVGIQITLFLYIKQHDYISNWKW